MSEGSGVHDPERGQWLVYPDGRRQWLPVPPCGCGKGPRCPFCERECLDQGEGAPASSPVGVAGGGIDDAGVPSRVEEAL